MLLLNISLNTQEIPEVWKSTNAVPLSKKVKLDKLLDMSSRLKNGKADNGIKLICLRTS